MRKIINFLPYKARVGRSLISVYLYDAIRFYKNSAVFERSNSQGKLKSFITKAYHVVEKGLTMPQTRLGFGKENVVNLIKLCYKYDNLGYDKSDTSFQHALSVLAEYLKFHREKSFNIEASLHKEIDEILNKFSNREASNQLHYSKEDFLAPINSSFDKFCLSRRTVRNYSDENIPDEIFQKVIELALSSPSPCNRQPNRVYIIKDRIKIEKILNLQNGNRGFGYLGNALLVFTSDLSLFHDTYERNEAFLNSGKFAMSFIFGLHYYEIGSCCLNWSVSPKTDRKLRKVVPILDGEVITMLLVCGYLPDNFSSASSPKENWQDVSSFII